MTRQQIVKLADGSSIDRDDEELEPIATGGMATGLLAEALDMTRAPAVRALEWHRAAIPEARQALAAAYAWVLRDESIWLLRPDPLACVAGSGDQMLAGQLEPRVVAFDATVENHELDDVREAARRQIVHAELRGAGLFEPELLERRAEVLRELACPTLASCATAAAELLVYYANPQRATRLRNPRPGTILEGGLALDWARFAVIEEPVVRLGAFFEAEASLPNPVAQDRNQVVLRVGKVKASMKWRLEYAGQHKIYAGTFRL